MCQVSDKIKFCTCSPEKLFQPGNYWVLYRYNKRKNISMIGETFLPYSIDIKQDEMNRQNLLDALNNTNSFDKPLEFQNGDLLLVSLKCGSEPGERLDYGFHFNNGSWEEKIYSCFQWETKHDKVKRGEVRTP
jgi:hypothetical protein